MRHALTKVVQFPGSRSVVQNSGCRSSGSFAGGHSKRDKQIAATCESIAQGPAEPRKYHRKYHTPNRFRQTTSTTTTRLPVNQRPNRPEQHSNTVCASLLIPRCRDRDSGGPLNDENPCRNIGSKAKDGESREVSQRPRLPTIADDCRRVPGICVQIVCSMV